MAEIYAHLRDIEAGGGELVDNIHEISFRVMEQSIGKGKKRPPFVAVRCASFDQKWTAARKDVFEGFETRQMVRWYKNIT